MNDLLNQGWYALEMAWTKAKCDISGHIVIAVTIAAILVLFWVFLSPQVKSKGS